MQTNDDGHIILKREDDIKLLYTMSKQVENTANDVSEIKNKIDNYNGLKTDVSWLKNWHNKIVLGVIFSIMIGFIALILK